MKTFERERTTLVAGVSGREIILGMYFLRTFAIVFVISLLFYLAQKLFIYSDVTFSSLLSSTFQYFLGATAILLLIQFASYFYYELKNRKKVEVGRNEVIMQYAVSILLIVCGLIVLYALNAL